MANFGLHQESIEKIFDIFRRYPQVESVLIYGSRAKGTQREGSDIDLTMLGEGLSSEILRRIELELDDLLLPYTIDLSIYAQINHVDLLDHIKRVGKVFYLKKS